MNVLCQVSIDSVKHWVFDGSIATNKSHLILEVALVNLKAELSGLLQVDLEASCDILVNLDGFIWSSWVLHALILLFERVLRVAAPESVNAILWSLWNSIPG